MFESTRWRLYSLRRLFCRTSHRRFRQFEVCGEHLSFYCISSRQMKLYFSYFNLITENVSFYYYFILIICVGEKGEHVYFQYR